MIENICFNKFLFVVRLLYELLEVKIVLLLFQFLFVLCNITVYFFFWRGKIKFVMYRAVHFFAETFNPVFPVKCICVIKFWDKK